MKRRRWLYGDKDREIDTSWILSTFDHDLYMFSKFFICIWSLFRAFTGLGTYLRKIVILEYFGTIFENYAEITKSDR